MAITRFFQHCCIAFFLLVTSAALGYTLLRIPAFLRVPLASFSYAMTAPYQGFERENMDVRAEGLDATGGVHPIDLTRYYQVGRGEAVARRRLFPFRARGEESLREAYRRLALQLLTHEREAGRAWTQVRLFFDAWPLSTEAYEELRHAPFLHSTLLVEVP